MARGHHLGTLLVNNAQALDIGNVTVNGGVLGADPQPINVLGNYTQNAAGTLQLSTCRTLERLGVSSQNPSVNGDIADAKRLCVIHEQRAQVDHRATAVGVPSAQNRCSGAVLNHVTRAADVPGIGNGA